MRCHYEVLDVPRDVSGEELTKVYRKLALKFHPDKNLENVEEATEKFKELQQAYDVLSDPQERAWYDRHREEILKGGLGADYKDASLDVFQYFNSSCYSGYNDGPQGFYTVFGEVFSQIATEDLDFVDEAKLDFKVPTFGKSDSSYDQVVHEFYAYWQSYCTAKSYTWADKYDIRSAPNRRVVRLMEKENKKLRDQMRKKRNEEVRALVAFVRKRDKRVQAYRKKLEEKAAENARKAELNRKKQIEERQRLLEDYQESQWASMSNLEHELKLIESSVSQEFRDTTAMPEQNGSNDQCDESEEDANYDVLYCVACDKHFKTEKAFANHENSKKHKENISFLRTAMVEEENNFTMNGAADETEQLDLDATDSDVSASEEEFKSEKNRSKKKKKSRQAPRIPSTGDGEAGDILPETEPKIDVAVNEESADVKPATPVPQTAPKLKGKKAKEAKRKAKLECAATAPASTVSEGTDEASRRCVVCGTTFTTRNKLFDHLKETGHAIAVSKHAKPSAMDAINSRRTKKNKEKS